MAEVPASAFVESTECLSSSDVRDEFIKQLKADCAHLRERAWNLRKLCSDDDQARRDLAESKISIDDLLTIHDRFTAAEDEFNRLLEDLEHRLHQFNRGKPLGQRVYVSHTAEGLAIQFCANRRVPTWGI